MVSEREGEKLSATTFFFTSKEWIRLFDHAIIPMDISDSITPRRSVKVADAGVFRVRLLACDSSRLSSYVARGRRSY